MIMKYSRSDLSNAVISPTYRSTNDKVPAFALKREDKKFRRALRKKAKGSRTYRHRIPKRYKGYIKSIYWTRRKNRYYQKYGRRCAVSVAGPNTSTCTTRSTRTTVTSATKT